MYSFFYNFLFLGAYPLSDILGAYLGPDKLMSSRHAIPFDSADLQLLLDYVPFYLSSLIAGIPYPLPLCSSPLGPRLPPWSCIIHSAEFLINLQTLPDHTQLDPSGGSGAYPLPCGLYLMLSEYWVSFLTVLLLVIYRLRCHCYSMDLAGTGHGVCC